MKKNREKSEIGSDGTFLTTALTDDQKEKRINKVNMMEIRFDSIYDEEENIDHSKLSDMLDIFLQDTTTGMTLYCADRYYYVTAKVLLSACVLLLVDTYPKVYHNMHGLYKLFQDARKRGGEGKRVLRVLAGLDMIFAEMKLKRPEAECVHIYDDFRRFTFDRIATGVIISICIGLNKFNNPDSVNNS